MFILVQSLKTQRRANMRVLCLIEKVEGNQITLYNPETQNNITLSVPDDENFDVIYSSLYEISEVLGLKRSGRTYNQLTNTLRNLRQKEVIIYNEETETANTPFVYIS